MSLESRAETGFHLSRLHLGGVLFSDFGLRGGRLILLRGGRLDESSTECRGEGTDGKNGPNAIGHFGSPFS